MTDVMGRFEFDGAENYAFWVSDDRDSEDSVPIFFDDLPVLLEFLKANFPGLFEEEWEYGWAGDSQASTFYSSREEAEEFMGAPKEFRRRKTGWEAV